MPSRWKVDRADAGPDGHWRRGQYETAVYLLRLCQSRPSAQPQGRVVLSDHTGRLRVHAQSYGLGYRDLGLGTFLRSDANPNSQWVQFAQPSDGQMQTSTARDVAMTPPQCPTTEAGQVDANGSAIPYFQKEFFHNGYIKSLKQLVHFYNTRDVFAFKVTSGNCPPGKTEKVDCWPMPEVPNNIDMTTGNLGLTDQEENQIVTFLQALTDGFTTPYPDINTFTGQCMTGGTAATQGSELLITTPPLPPCAPAICGVSPLPGPNMIP